MENNEKVNVNELNDVAGGNEEVKEVLENQENGLSLCECLDCGFKFSLNKRNQCPKCGSSKIKIIF